MSSTPFLWLALIGFWLPWLAQPASALQLSAYELAEWQMFAPQVLFGDVGLNRMSFLAGAAALCVAFGMPVGRARRGHRRGELVLSVTGAALAAGTALPYYPYVLSAYQDPEFATQFWMTAAAVGLAVILAGLPDRWASGGAVVAVGFAIWWPLSALLTLRPIGESILAGPWPIGPGPIVYAAGLALAALALFHAATRRRYPFSTSKDTNTEA
jgi:hypothetical protein